MGLINEVRARARQVSGPIIGISALLYFGYHAVNGDRGLIALWRLEQKVAQVEAEHARVSARRQAIEHRVRLLHPMSIDPDMLDERARLMLNYARPDDIVILEWGKGRDK